MNTQIDRSNVVRDHLVFILIFNAIFWLLAVLVSAFRLAGQQCFDRLFPVVVGGACMAIVAVVLAWRQQRIRN